VKYYEIRLADQKIIKLSTSSFIYWRNCL